MRVGVYGGSFNPPHIAHLLIAELMREEFRLSQVLWVVSPRPPHKDPTALAPADDRLAMVELAIAGNTCFSVSDIELRREGPSYTIDTLRQLRDELPGSELCLLLGGDSLAEFDSWRSPDAILTEAHLLVYERAQRASYGRIAHSERVHFSSSPSIDISSSAIRRRIRQGQTTRYLVPEPVRAYIARRVLYGFMPEHDD